MGIHKYNRLKAASKRVQSEVLFDSAEQQQARTQFKIVLAEKEKTGTLIKAISFDIPILEYSNTNLWGTSLIDEDGNCNWIKEKE